MFHPYATEAQLAFTACFGMYTILFDHALLMVGFKTSILVLWTKMFCHYVTEAQLALPHTLIVFRIYKFLLPIKFFTVVTISITQ